MIVCIVSSGVGESSDKNNQLNLVNDVSKRLPRLVNYLTS